MWDHPKRPFPPSCLNKPHSHTNTTAMFPFLAQRCCHFMAYNFIHPSICSNLPGNFSSPLCSVHLFSSFPLSSTYVLLSSFLSVLLSHPKPPCLPRSNFHNKSCYLYLLLYWLNYSHYQLYPISHNLVIVFLLPAQPCKLSPFPPLKIHGSWMCPSEGRRRMCWPRSKPRCD